MPKFLIPIKLIAAIDINNGLGKDGKLLYRIPKDMEFFTNRTTETINPDKKNIVVMGRKTWTSIPSKFRPLKNRVNLVLSNSNYTSIKKELKDTEHSVHKNMVELIQKLGSIDTSQIETVYIIGGETLYTRFLELADEILITHIYDKKDSPDTFFPKISKNNFKTNILSNIESNYSKKSSKILLYQFISYTRNTSINMEEQAYLDLLSKVLREGERRETRSGATYSLFGERLSFSLEDNTIPLLTTKRVFFRGIAEELLWFLRGSTDAKELDAKRVRIWNGNTSREFLDSLGLDYPEGTCGPVYGFQWRHFNAPYKGADADYTGKGVDQLAECIRLIKENPTSRRIFMSAWNPCQLPEMCLPCCHVSYQWYVNPIEKTISCQMYQRSGDLFLGVPFNIASTSLLTHMIAKMTGLTAKKVHVCIGDAHIYEDHLEAVQTQLQREPTEFPKLYIKRVLENIEDCEYADLKLVDYHHQGGIKATMNV